MCIRDRNKNDCVKEITNIEENFTQWYTDVVLKAELADYADTKGCIAIRPYGYAIWENIQKYADEKFKEIGVTNLCMPLLIPESLLNKEKEHVEGLDVYKRQVEMFISFSTIAAIAPFSIALSR